MGTVGSVSTVHYVYIVQYYFRLCNVRCAMCNVQIRKYNTYLVLPLAWWSPLFAPIKALKVVVTLYASTRFPCNKIKLNLSRQMRNWYLMQDTLYLAPGRSKVPHTLCLSCTWCAAPSKLAPTVQPLRSYLFVPLAFEICVAKTVRCRQNPDLSYQIVKQYLPLEELKFKYSTPPPSRGRNERTRWF